MSEADQPYSPAVLETGRLLFAKECTFIAGVADLSQLDDIPGLSDPELPEIAFAGRSNVGKSSLVNALTGRKTLARTSNTPGRTQQLNFFNLGDRAMLVDLPGYGFAKVSKTQIAAWTETMSEFLKGRAPLRRVCLLIDSRHGLKDSDREMMEMLDITAVSYQIVLTKTDKIKREALDALTSKLSAELIKRPAAHPTVMPTSSAKGWGIADLRAELATLAESA